MGRRLRHAFGVRSPRATAPPSEGNKTRHCRTVTPEGRFSHGATLAGVDEDVVVPAKGKAAPGPSRRAWGSMREISKAVEASEDSSPANFARLLEREHKARNF